MSDKSALEQLQDMPVRGVVKSFNPDGEEVAVEQKKVQKDYWPDGPHEPTTGWDPYYKGIHLVAELGLMRVRSQCVLVRAVSSDVMKGTGLASVRENSLRALAFEIMDIADDFPIGMLYHEDHNPTGLRVGDHILHLSASQDRLDPRDGGCPWFFVEAPDIAGSWRPQALRDVLSESKGKDLEELIEIARPFAEVIRRTREEINARRWERHLEEERGE